MSTVDVTVLLSPVSEASPCGPDLTGSPEMLQLVEVAKAPESRMIGDAADDDRNWGVVRERALGLLRRSKDLRIAHYLTHALLQTEGVAGLATGLLAVRTLLERFWEHLHPELDADDDNDPTLRLNCLRELCDPSFLATLRGLPLVSTQPGRFALRDIQIARGELPADPEQTAASESTIRAAFQAAGDAAVDALRGHLRTCLDHTGAIPTLCLERSGTPLQLKDLTDTLQAMSRAVDAMYPPRTTGPAPETNGQGPVVDGAGGPAMPITLQGISSRQEVVEVLDRICEYYQRNEPSSPVPLLLRRAKRLVHLEFVDLVRDLADKGIPQLEVLAGQSKDD